MIVHADLDFGCGYLQLGAANPAFRLVLPPGDGNACYSLGVYVPDVDQTLARAVAHGATVREPATTFVSGGPLRQYSGSVRYPMDDHDAR